LCEVIALGNIRAVKVLKGRKEVKESGICVFGVFACYGGWECSLQGYSALLVGLVSGSGRLEIGVSRVAFQGF